MFEDWFGGMIAWFVSRSSRPPPRHQWLSLLEGAFIFCRALRRTEPLDVAGAAAAVLVRAAKGQHGNG